MQTGETRLGEHHRQRCQSRNDVGSGLRVDEMLYREIFM